MKTQIELIISLENEVDLCFEVKRRVIMMDHHTHARQRVGNVSNFILENNITDMDVFGFLLVYNFFHLLSM